MRKDTRHHRKPRSLGGTSEPENISHVPAKKHAAWHILFRNLPADQIAEEINRTYLDPDFRFVLERR